MLENHRFQSSSRRANKNAYSHTHTHKKTRAVDEDGTGYASTTCFDGDTGDHCRLHGVYISCERRDCTDCGSAARVVDPSDQADYRCQRPVADADVCPEQRSHARQLSVRGDRGYKQARVQRQDRRRGRCSRADSSGSRADSV